MTVENWTEILEKIMVGIYRYINADSSEGQDILNMFFIAFNKYTGRADKNQAFTPDHITDFMCRVVDVDKTKVIFDGTCGSGSFLVQAMVKEFADCRRNTTEEEAKKLIKKLRMVIYLELNMRKRPLDCQQQICLFMVMVIVIFCWVICSKARSL